MFRYVASISEPKEGRRQNHVQQAFQPAFRFFPQLYALDDTNDFVNENDDGYRSDVLLKLCGNYAKLKEFPEKCYRYGFKPKKKKGRTLGRAADASDESKAENQKRVNARRRETVIDKVHCNEDDLPIFASRTYQKEFADVQQANRDRQAYQKRLIRFIQTGRLYGREVQNFVPVPDFELKCVGVIEFQDRGVIHTHEVRNTPFLPQVQVIVADVFDLADGEHKQAYLQTDGTWGRVAGEYTVWFDTAREASDYLKDHPELKTDLTKDPRKKPECVDALLWGHGYIDLKTVQNMRKCGKCADVGGYMTKYMVKDTEDPRLQGQKAHYQAGKLAKPQFFRDPEDVRNVMAEMEMWQVLINQYDCQVQWLGTMLVYVFNFWALVYPWIRTYYAKRQQGQKMSAEDWRAADVHPIENRAETVF